MEPSTHPRKILVAPLDWGLGHAARIIPLVQALNRYGDCQIILGISGPSGTFLENELPGFQTIPLPSPGVRYSRKNRQIPTLLAQLPRLAISLWRENQQMKKLVKAHELSAVISDNRYGLFHKKIPSVLLIHQVNFSFSSRFWGLGFRLATKLQHWWFSKFDQVWVPDQPGVNSIGGSLTSFPSSWPQVFRIGLLSRFFYGMSDLHHLPGSYPVVALLSGPEPQRSQLEEAISRQMTVFKKDTLIIRGVNGEGKFRQQGCITYISHMFSDDLRGYLKSASIILCRSGYSSVMDLIALQKQAVLIPTPGQPEQEYLARYLFHRGWFYYQLQNELNLKQALERCEAYLPPRTGVSGQLFTRINWLFEKLKETEGQNEHPHPQSET